MTATTVTAGSYGWDYHKRALELGRARWVVILPQVQDGEASKGKGKESRFVYTIYCSDVICSTMDILIA